MEFFKNDGVRTGLYFGATSGVITTIGLVTGLNAGTGSVAAVLGLGALPVLCRRLLQKHR